MIDEDEYDEYIDYLKIFKTHLEKLHTISNQMQIAKETMHRAYTEFENIQSAVNDAINKIRWIEFKELPKDE